MSTVSSHSIDDDANKAFTNLLTTIRSILNLTNCVNIVGNGEEIFLQRRDDDNE